MGLFDTVYINTDVLARWRLHCSACGKPASTDLEWQTKSLNPCMHSYFLRYDESRAIRLYLLDRPSDRRFWRAWTDEEIEESKREAQRGGFLALWRKEPGEGRYLPEAYLPQNRRQRFMGELPHQWVKIYGSCACEESLDYWIKFSDGVAAEFRSEEPTPGAGFFDDAGDLFGAERPEISQGPSRKDPFL
jgi:hypothetical protein